MGHCVFLHRSDSIYDDVPAERYQFPSQYRQRASGSVGDWIVYLEPAKVPATRGYFAIARVERIVPDPSADDMYLAIIERGSYLDFAQPVRFNDGALPVERGLLNEAGKLSGRAQAAVRPLAPEDFRRIVDRGLEEPAALLPRTAVSDVPGFEEPQAPYDFDQAPERWRHLSSRLVRDRVFRTIVLRAYDERCAVSGLKLINGGGRAEVDAAHIRPVHRGGPDYIGNGIALSGTAHWMFDRGLISLGDDLEILVSRQVNDREGVRAFVNRSGFAHAPSRSAERPHPRFLKWHREHCFKG